MMERWMCWPGGTRSISIKDEIVGIPEAAELARVRLALGGKGGRTKWPDILDMCTKEVYEIKPVSDARGGLVQLYSNYINPLRDAGLPYKPGDTWKAQPVYHVRDKLVLVQQFPHAPGLILYYLVPLFSPPVYVPEWAQLAALAVAFVVLLLTPADEVAAVTAGAIAAAGL
jgi:hypothetical protein